MSHRSMQRALSGGLLVIAIALTSGLARASELLVMSGTEPLRSRVNESKESVRLLFLGSPT